MKSKLLCILHRSPPAHGAAKVGDFIASSQKLQDEFECKFITIKSSDTIGDIGKVNLKKFYFVAELFVKIASALILFRPDKIYFTASIRSVAFYRDLLVATLWKFYRLFTSVDVYYHYHTKGIDKFVSSSARNLKLTNFFVRDVTMVLLSPLLAKDLEKVSAYKNVLFLPNGVEDSMKDQDFESYLEYKYSHVETVQALYLAHMMKEKGYWEVLELAQSTKDKNIHYNFAGSWKDEESQKEFFDFIQKHQLQNSISYHGFVSGEKKKELFENVHILLYPSKNDAFPLTLLESLLFGVPILATDEGSIPYILDELSGIVIDDVQKLSSAFDEALGRFITVDTAQYCRQRYLENFTLERFEENLIKVIS